MEKDARNIISRERISRKNIPNKSEINLIMTLREMKPKYRTRAPLKLASLIYLVAETPTCTPIKEPRNMRAANMKSIFPLRVCVKDAYKQLNNLSKMHVPAATDGL